MFRITTEISKQVFPISLDTDSPAFRAGLDHLHGACLVAPVSEPEGQKSGRLLTRHQFSAAPALLESTLYQFSAAAAPASLRHILQRVKQFAGSRLLIGFKEPDFRKALIRRQIADTTGKKSPLHADDDSFALKAVCP